MAGNDTSPKDPNPGTGSDAEASQQLARVALVPQPASARDGAPVLASALEKCGQEKFLAGVVCEQKVRLQYCEGKWGQVPECTGKGRAE